MHRRQEPERTHAPERIRPIDPDAYALAQLALRTENYREAEARLRALLDALAADEPPESAAAAAAPRPSPRDASLLLAETLYQCGRFDDALAACEEGHRRAWLAPDDPEAALVRGWVLLRRGQARPAREIARRHLRGGARPAAGAPGAASALGPPAPTPPRVAIPSGLRARLLHLSGMCDHRLGRPRQARRALRDAAALFRAANDPAGAAEALNALGTVEKSSVSLPAAAARFEEALRINRAHGQPARRAQNLLNLAIVRLKEGRAEAAHSLLREATTLAPADAAPQLRLRLRLALARVQLQRGELDGARADAEAVLTATTMADYARDAGLAHETLGDVAAAAGQDDEARSRYNSALLAAAAIAPGGDLEVETLRRLGELDLRAGQPAVAAVTLRRAARLARVCGERFEEGCARRALAEAHLALAQWGDAYRSCRAALALLRDLGAGLEAARCQLLAAHVRLAWWRAQRGEEESLEQLPHSAAFSAALPRGHLEAAWSYAIEAFHAFDGLGRDADRAACEELMQGMRAEGGTPGAAMPRPCCPSAERRVDLSDAPPWRPGEPPFVARAPAMRRLLELATVAAASDDPVLITGETGTGKEVVARLVHGRSRRAAGPFVPVNCAAIPDTLFEREFFGHARGAYTGADRDQPGLCEAADGGTLFLDEIGDMPLPVQAKLLRLLQERSFRRLGEPRERLADLRVVAATNTDLPTLITHRRFRQDLYYRLQTLELSLPPLRDRPDDLAPLIVLFARRALDAMRATPSGHPLPAVRDLFDDDVLLSLRAYAWPGNVRELEAMTRRLTLLAVHAGRATSAMLPPAISACRRPPRAIAADLSLALFLAHAERERILQTLALAAGNRAAAARSLGISRNALYKKMERLRIAAAP